LNPVHRKLLKAAIWTVAATLLFPPFVFYHPQGGALGTAFGFLLSPPEHPIGGEWTGIVDVPLLVIEWLAIGIVLRILWVLFRTTAPVKHTDIILRWIDTQVEIARINADAIKYAAEIRADQQNHKSLRGSSHGD
jgi:hypothetical protein